MVETRSHSKDSRHTISHTDQKLPKPQLYYRDSQICAVGIYWIGLTRVLQGCVWQLEAEIIEMMVMKENEESQCKNVCVGKKAAGVGNESM